MAFEVAYAGHQNQQESLCFVQFPAVKQEKTEIDETIEVVECPPLPCSPSKLLHKNIKKKDIKTLKLLQKKSY